jgi:hypothetical protein
MWQARRALRHETCEPGTGFRRCSDLDRDACEQHMHGALAACAEQITAGLPERVAAGRPDEVARAQLTGCMWHRAAVELGPVRVDMLCLLKSATHRGS